MALYVMAFYVALVIVGMVGGYYARKSYDDAMAGMVLGTILSCILWVVYARKKVSA